MAQYKVVSAYAGKVNGRAHVRWKVGSEVDIDKADADWVNRDAPGTLTAVKAAPASGGPRRGS